MASLAGAITTLGLVGLSVAAPVWDSEYSTTPRPYTQTFSKLALDGTSAVYAVDFSGKSEETEALLSASDSALLSATEGPVDEQLIEVADIARLSATETVAVFRYVTVTDTASLSASEVVALAISGVADRPVTDTASLAATEAVVVAVQVAVTDSAALSATESATVDVSIESVDVTDSASLSATESALLTVFAGVNELTAVDNARLAATETTSVLRVDGGIGAVISIRFEIKSPSIRFEFL